MEQLKKNTHKRILFLIVVFALYGMSFNAAKAFSANFSTFTPDYEIVDVEANFFSDNTKLFVCGKVKNTSFSPLSGHIIVRLKDKNNMNIGFVEAPVNEKMPIQHSKTGEFEVSIDIEKSVTPQNVSVEFMPISRH